MLLVPQNTVSFNFYIKFRIFLSKNTYNICIEIHAFKNSAELIKN